MPLKFHVSKIRVVNPKLMKDPKRMGALFLSPEFVQTCEAYLHVSAIRAYMPNFPHCFSDKEVNLDHNERCDILFSSSSSCFGFATYATLIIRRRSNFLFPPLLPFFLSFLFYDMAGWQQLLISGIIYAQRRSIQTKKRCLTHMRSLRRKFCNGLTMLFA